MTKQTQQKQRRQMVLEGQVAREEMTKIERKAFDSLQAQRAQNLRVSTMRRAAIAGRCAA